MSVSATSTEPGLGLDSSIGAGTRSNMTGSIVACIIDIRTAICRLRVDSRNLRAMNALRIRLLRRYVTAPFGIDVRQHLLRYVIILLGIDARQQHDRRTV